MMSKPSKSTGGYIGGRSDEMREQLMHRPCRRGRYASTQLLVAQRPSQLGKPPASIAVHDIEHLGILPSRTRPETRVLVVVRPVDHP
jgi:hypothetical protein